MASNTCCDQPAGLITPEVALDRMLSSLTVEPQPEWCALEQALSRTVAESVQASCDVPPAANSAMDGYAVAWSDLATQQAMPLAVSQRVAAGQGPQPLSAGTCARIFTGAEIPPGADTVIMQEAVTPLEDGQVLLPAQSEISQGQNIRAQGQDIRAGQTVVSAGTVLAPWHLGILASVGVAQVPVVRRLKVAVLCTGDELVLPGQPLAPGQIYNSNRFMLAGLIERMGHDAWVIDTVEDTLAATLDALDQAAQEADLIVTTGGVSVGEEDHVKPAIEQRGHLSVWKVAIKPGKPVAFGHIQAAGDTDAPYVPVLGLPGNPVSVFVGTLVYLAPLLAHCVGQAYQVQQGTARLVGGWQTRGRQEYLRVQGHWIDGDYWLTPCASQSSGVLSAVAEGNALAILPPHQQFAEGDWVHYIAYS